MKDLAPITIKNVAVYHCKGYEMKTFKTLALAAAISAGLLGAAGAMAEKQGTLGSTSDGDFDITLVHAAGVRIWGLQDFNFNTEAGTTLQQRAINICVFTNSSSSTTDGQYDIVATGSDPELSSGAGQTLPYTVEYSDSKDASDGYDTLITTGTIANEVGELNAGNLFTQPDPANGDVCNDTIANANIRVTVDPSTAAYGTYTGTVYLAITPN